MSVKKPRLEPAPPNQERVSRPETLSEEPAEGLERPGEPWLCLAQIGRPWGLRGHLWVRPFVSNLRLYRRFYARALERYFDVVWLSAEPIRGHLRAAFRQIQTRTEAETFRGQELCIHRDTLPPLRQAEEVYYYADLIGITVLDAQKQSVGHVRQVQNFGAQDILEIEKSDQTRAMVPFTKEAVLRIQLDEKKITIDTHFLI